jgi:hypothetical protein
MIENRDYRKKRNKWKECRARGEQEGSGRGERKTEEEE